MHMFMYMLMRDEEGKKKEASKVIQKQNKSTQHTQGSHFSKEKCAASGGIRTHDTLHSRHVHVQPMTLYTPDMYMFNP